MDHSTTSKLLISFCLSGLAAEAIAEPTVAPAIGQRFAWPLADGTTGQAILLPKADGVLYLVYSTPGGKIGFWTMTPSPSSEPTPEPNPIRPPEPEPAKDSLAMVIIVTPEERTALPEALGTALKEHAATFRALTVSEVADPMTETNDLTWIGRTAGKQYPYAFAITKTGAILWEGQPPKEPAAFVSLLVPYFANTVTTVCPDGNCPKNRKEPKK
jgi:hypothetical protein